jgi:2-oxoglutarate ferredoxin oxidoreductase subunit gamma
MEHRIVAAGFGGQGILMIGKLLAHAGMMDGRHVTWLPSYGPEMRGGTANCSVIVSGEVIGAPIVSEATCVIAMNLPSFERFAPLVLPGGLLLSNSSLVPKRSRPSGVLLHEIPATEIAQRQGSPKVANVVMLGACVALSGAVRKESVVAAIEDVLGKSKRHLLAINLGALEEGMKCAHPVSA